jgi:hypothetical protein
MAKKRAPKLREDMAETARRVFLESVGEQPKTLPPDERTEKNPEAVKRGRKGGKVGGAERSSALSKRRRSRIARKAATKRWESRPDKPDKPGN